MGSFSAPAKATQAWFVNTLVPYLNGTLEDRLDEATGTLFDVVKPGGTLSQKFTVPPDGKIPLAMMPPGTTIELRPGAQGWGPRPTASTNVIYIWTRHSLSEPAVPIGTVGGQLFAIVGHDKIDQPLA